jgi:hypothetical protein
MRPEHTNNDGRSPLEPPKESARASGRALAIAPASCDGPVIGHYDLTVHGAQEKWTQIRWALFVFPDIMDVTPTEDPNVARVLHEGTRAHANVWRVELLQAGFDVPPLEDAPPSARRRARTSSPSPRGGAPRRASGPSPITLGGAPRRAPFPLRPVAHRADGRHQGRT